MQPDQGPCCLTGQMVWEWRFVGEGKRVAVLSGPVHGDAAVAGLYNTDNGRVLADVGWQEHSPHVDTREGVSTFPDELEDSLKTALAGGDFECRARD